MTRNYAWNQRFYSRNTRISSLEIIACLSRLSNVGWYFSSSKIAKTTFPTFQIFQRFSRTLNVLINVHALWAMCRLYWRVELETLFRPVRLFGTYYLYFYSKLHCCRVHADFQNSSTVRIFSVGEYEKKLIMKSRRRSGLCISYQQCIYMNYSDHGTNNP